jgi:UDP-N-acetylmuramyl pentapeptide phosphotransferase/UDP-N-acetylglucosamine-1-phosphate transferase
VITAEDRNLTAILYGGDREMRIRQEMLLGIGGLIILASILIPALLFAKLDNIYILMMMFTTVWLGGIGFLDDYIKVFKKNKRII